METDSFGIFSQSNLNLCCWGVQSDVRKSNHLPTLALSNKIYLGDHLLLARRSLLLDIPLPSGIEYTLGAVHGAADDDWSRRADNKIGGVRQPRGKTRSGGEMADERQPPPSVEIARRRPKRAQQRKDLG